MFSFSWRASVPGLNDAMRQRANPQLLGLDNTTHLEASTVQMSRRLQNFGRADGVFRDDVWCTGFRTRSSFLRVYEHGPILDTLLGCPRDIGYFDRAKKKCDSVL